MSKKPLLVCTQSWNDLKRITKYMQDLLDGILYWLKCTLVNKKNSYVIINLPEKSLSISSLNLFFYCWSKNFVTLKFVITLIVLLNVFQIPSFKETIFVMN